MSYFERINKRRGKGCRRLIAGFVAALFFIQAVAPSSSWAISTVAQPKIDTASILEKLEIPALFGTVDKVVLKNNNQGKRNPAPIILIQDAHSNPEAQRNIANILEVLKREEKINGIGLEGAFGEVKPSLIQLFDDSKANQRMVDYLSNLGELTGAELFGYGHELPIQGIDDPGVYEKSYKNFIEVKKDPLIKPFLSELLKKQQEAERLYFSSKLRDFVSARRRWNSNGEDAAGYFKKLSVLAEKELGIDLAQARHQFEQPNLVRIVKAAEIEKQFNIEKTRMEIHSLRAVLRKSMKPGWERRFFLKSLKHFQKDPLGQHFLDLTDLPPNTPILSVRHFFERLYEVTNQYGLTLLNYPALLDAAGLAIMLNEVDAAGLLKELQPLEEKLEAKLAPSSEAKRTLLLDQKRVLIEKLLKLSLTSLEYGQISSSQENISTAKIVRAYDALVKQNPVEFKEPQEAFRRANLFYQEAIERDRLLGENGIILSKKLSKRKLPKAVVLVVGGFHQEGLVKFLEEKDISYALITPKVGLSEGESFYEKVMLGQNSKPGFQAKADKLNPRVLFETQQSFGLGAESAGRRPGVIWNALLHVLSGQDRGAIERAFQRAEQAGFFSRVVSSVTGSNLEVSIPELGQSVRVTMSGEVTSAVFQADRVISPKRDVGFVRAWFKLPAPEAVHLLFAVSFTGAGVLLLTPVRKFLRPDRVRASRSEIRQLPLDLESLTPEAELDLLENIILPELLKQREHGNGQLPVSATFSDIHGALERLDPMLVDTVLRELPDISEPQKKEMQVKIIEALRAKPLTSLSAVFQELYGIDLKSAFAERGAFHNGGDLVDRGPQGIQTVLRVAELFDLGLASSITGNHDLYALMGLLGFHLPWYPGFNFYGYADEYGLVETAVDAFRKSEPEKANDKGWWSRNLKIFEEYQNQQQASKWNSLYQEVRGTDGKSGMFATVKKGLNPEQERVWNVFSGWYLVNIPTGTKAVGSMSVNWWQELLNGKTDASNPAENFKGFKQLYEEIKGQPDFNPETPVNQAWQRAIQMIQDEILPGVTEDFYRQVDGPQKYWWWRVFDAINYKSITSPEWYAKDWAVHGNKKNGWGPMLFGEQTDLNRTLGIPGAEIDLATFLDEGPTTQLLREVKSFFMRSFNLALRDVYLNTRMHAFLPVVKEGEAYEGRFYFEYKGQLYRGDGDKEADSIWEGLQRISTETREIFARMQLEPENEGLFLQELQEPFRVMTSWYADMTTESKPKDIAWALKTFGAQRFFEMNGAMGLLMTGHVPIRSLLGLSESDRQWLHGFLAGKGVFMDRSWSEAYGYWGGILLAGLTKGLLLRGYRSAGSNIIEDHPPTAEDQPGADSDSEPMQIILANNPGIDPAQFVTSTIEVVQERIRSLQTTIKRSEMRSDVDADFTQKLWNILGLSSENMTQDHELTLRYLHDFLAVPEIAGSFSEADVIEKLRKIPSANWLNPYNAAEAILDSGFFVPGSEEHNLKLLKRMELLLKGINSFVPGSPLDRDEGRSIVVRKAKEKMQQIERSSEKQFVEMQRDKTKLNEYIRGRQDVLYILSIPVFAQMGLEGVPRLIDFLEPQYSGWVQRDAVFQLKGKEAVDYLLEQVMLQESKTERTRLVRYLDRLSQPGAEHLLILAGRDEELAERLRGILANSKPTFEDLLSSELYVSSAAAHDKKRIGKGMDAIETFRGFFSEDQYKILLKNWGIAAIAHWALDPQIGKKIMFFNPLYEVETAGNRDRLFVEAVSLAEENNSPEFTRGVLEILMSVGDLSVLRGMVSLIVQDTSRTHLITFLIAQMKLWEVEFQEDDFIQVEISRLLHSDLEGNYYLIRKLVSSIPHARRATGSERTIRELSHQLDRKHSYNNALFRYLRLKLHSAPSTSDLEMLETAIELLRGIYPKFPNGRLSEEEVDLKMQIFKADARAEVLAAIKSDEGRRLGETLNSVLPDEIARGLNFLKESPLWERAVHKDPFVLETAQLLIDLFRNVDSRYGIGRRFLSEEDQARLDAAPVEVLDVIRNTLDKRVSAKKIFLETADFDPEDESQVTKEIDYKRHIADREWGFKTTGFYARYTEGRFSLFEEDRGFERLEEVLQEHYLNHRVPVLLENVHQQLIAAQSLSSDAGTTVQKEQVREAMTEIFSALTMHVEMMVMDGTANRRLAQLNRELSRPGLELLQISNILSLMQDEIQHFFSHLVFEYGDYPKQVVQQVGTEGIRRRYRKPGDEHLPLHVVAARAQEALLADLYAEEGSVRVLKNYLEILHRFFAAIEKRDFIVYEPQTLQSTPSDELAEFHSRDDQSMIEAGGKGWELSSLKDRGYPVPPFTILPASLPQHVQVSSEDAGFRNFVIDALLLLERETNRAFPFDFEKMSKREKRKIVHFRTQNNVDPLLAPPLIISIRSGSFISMPGMMDTAVNVPFNEIVAEAMLKSGEDLRFVLDTYRRFLFSYGTVHLGLEQSLFSRIIDNVKQLKAEETGAAVKDIKISNFSQVDLVGVINAYKKLIANTQADFETMSSFEQVLRLVASVYQSWNSEGAQNYRKRFGISQKFGTAVVLQQMVYGNRNESSGSAVIDSSHAESAQRRPGGHYKPFSQGTELVSGTTGNAQPFNRDQGPNSLEETDPDLFLEMSSMVTRLERQEAGPQNVEITVDDKTVYLLQARPQTIGGTGVHKKLKPKDGDSAHAVIGQGLPVSANAAVGHLMDVRQLSAQELLERVGRLRTEMNQRGEEHLDIILVYDYFTDDDSSKLLQLTQYLQENFLTDAGQPIAGSIGILNSKIAESNHASLIAIRLGLAYVGKVDTLSFNDANEIVFGTQVLQQGLQGPIISIDGHSRTKSEFSGQVILGHLPFEVRTPTVRRSEVRADPSAAPRHTLIPVDQSLVQLNRVQSENASFYETNPQASLDYENPWLVQQYLLQVYNTLADVARDMSTTEHTYQPHEVQVHDQLITELSGDERYQALWREVVAPERLQSGFVDTMDLFRVLARMRDKTEIAAYPEIRLPKYGAPEKIALVVDAKVSDLEAAFFRDLIGNPDMAIEVVVGTTPVQLAATLNHSIYRRFLRTGDVRYEQDEGWIEILGRRIQVVQNEEDIPGRQWQSLGVRTFVATHSIRRRAAKIAAAVAADMDEGSPNLIPIRIISLGNINPFAGNPAGEDSPMVSLDFTGGDAVTKMEPKQILLRSALTDVPVRFLAALKPILNSRTLEAATYTVSYTISPTMAPPLDESGRRKSPVQNQIPVSAQWSRFLRNQMKEALTEADLPANALQSVSLSSIPAMMGDRAEITLQLHGKGIDELLKALKINKTVDLKKDDPQASEDKIRQVLVSKLGTALDAKLFAVFAQHEAVNTDARFDRRILIDGAAAQVNISQFAEGELQVSVTLPLVFNRDWQNSRHLFSAIREITRAEMANAPVRPETLDARLSAFGRAVDYAKRFRTFPPAALEIPEELVSLREKPLQIGVVGFAGQIGARLHVPHDLNLNIAAAIGGNPLDLPRAFDDSVVGPYVSNGVAMPIMMGELRPHEPDQIGWLKIGSGSEIILLRRYDDPRQIPWGQFGVEVVAETTGAFTDPTDPQNLLGHLETARGNQTGADAVLLSAPFGKPKDKTRQAEVDAFPTVVFGVNDGQVKTFLERAEEEGSPKIISNASCTTNCVATMTVFAQRLRAAVTRLMREKYNLVHAELGDVELAPVTTVHALTNTQGGYRDSFFQTSVDSRHRSAAQASLTKSGVSAAIRQLDDKDGSSFAKGATGYAVRVPIATSLAVVPFIFRINGLDREGAHTLDSFNQEATQKSFQEDVVVLYSQVGRAMAADPQFREAVSFGAPEDATTSELAAGSGQMVIDAQQVHVLRRGDLLTVTGNAWYDNVMHYAQNFLRILRQMADVMPVKKEKPEVDSLDDQARSEVRIAAPPQLLSLLAAQQRDLKTLLTVAQIAAGNMVDPPFAAQFPRFFRIRFGWDTSNETLSESPLLPALRQAVQQQSVLSGFERSSETPKTVVLASINGQVPVVDLGAMQLGIGSRLVILDSRNSAPVVWRAYEKRLPKNIRVERGVFEGHRPDLMTLQAHLAEAGVQGREQSASRVILLFPYVTEHVLDEYKSIPLENGLVVRSPRSARKNATLRFSFSYLLGRGMLPAQLLKETPSDVFQVRVQRNSLSPAYVPLGSEGRFADWAVTFAAHELLGSAA